MHNYDKLCMPLMAKSSTAPLLVLTNLLVSCALLIFALGFFPYKAFIPGEASFYLDQQDNGHRQPPFNKVIFMVVDALRRYHDSL